MLHCYFAPGGVRSIVINVSVCLFVCLLVNLKNHQFLYVLPVAVPSVLHWRQTGSARRYVLPVLWMTSCFHIMERIGQNQTQRVCFVQFARSIHRAIQNAENEYVLYRDQSMWHVNSTIR